MLAAVLWIAVGSGTDAFAVNSRTFPAGSYIIPVEPCWQPNNDPFGTSTILPVTCDPNRNDQGIFHAYGMVYDLLGLGIPVYWAIKPDKADRDDADFSVIKSGSGPAVTISHSAKADSGTLAQVDYHGGPFVIDANDLTPDVQARALNIINNVYTAAKVHRNNYDFTLNYDKVLSGTPPRVAVLGASSVNVLLQYLKASGLGNRMFAIYTEVSPDDIINGALNDYQLLWAPHWIMDDGDGTDDSGDEVRPQSKRDQLLAAIRAFLEKGGAGFFECASIGSLEGSWDFLTPARSQTRVIGKDSQTSGGFLTRKDYAFPRLDVNSHKITGLNQTQLTSIYNNDLVFENQAFYLTQCSGWKYIPSAGVLENFRPRHTAIPAKTTSPTNPAYPLSVNPYVYNTTVSRFIHDRDNFAYASPAPPGPPGTDYFIGGYINGGTKGYVAYLAGHQYVKCSNTGTPSPSERQIDIYFDRDICQGSPCPADNPPLTLVTIEAVYSGCTAGSTCPSITYDIANPTDVSSKDATLYLNAAGAVYDPVTFKISPVTIGNLAATTSTTVTRINATFTSQPLLPQPSAPPKVTKIIDVTDDTATFTACLPNSASPGSCTPRNGVANYVLGSLVTSCTVNWTLDTSTGTSNTCGIRYVLNTLLGLQFQVVPNEYAKAAPTVKDDVIYKGTFEFPGWKGHLYALDARRGTKLWDAGDRNVMPSAGFVNPGAPSKANTVRYVFTNMPGTTTLLDFDGNNRATLKPLLDPDNRKSDNGILALINEVRGRLIESETVPQGTRDVSKRLGGIERSTPAVLSRSRVIRDGTGVIAERDRIAFVGGNDGMLHAFYAGSWNSVTQSYSTGTGKEIWAYIPSTLLSSLQNQIFTDCNPGDSISACDPLTDPNRCVCPTFPAAVSVDSSPAIGDFFVDHDNDPATPNVWRTILVATASVLVPPPNSPQAVNQGIVFALDITDPYAPRLLWERTYHTAVDPTSSGIERHYYPEAADYNGGFFPLSYVIAEGTSFDINMGNSRGAAIGRVQVGTKLRTYVFVTSRWINQVNAGTVSSPHNVWGMSVYALDFRTGDPVWATKILSTGDAEGINETPAIPVLMDVDDTGTQDYVVFGDMQGRLWILRTSDGKALTDDAPAYVVKDSSSGLPVGAKEPIGASASVLRNYIVFGTGGRDSLSDESNTHFRVYALQLTPVGVKSLWTDPVSGRDTAMVLNADEKVWSAPLMDSQGNVYIATGQGYSGVGRPDLVRTGSTGRFILADRTTGAFKAAPVTLPGAVVGGIDIENKHAYVLTFDGKAVQIGGEDFIPSRAEGNPIKILWWKKL